MKNIQHDISFITINYNGLKDTKEFLNSILSKVHSISYEIIVVDNNSDNGEAQLLETEYPNIKVIKSSKNLGFSGGNNLGIKEAIGKHLMFINNDTFIEEDNFDKLIENFQDESIGIVCPKIRFSWGKRLIQYMGYTPLSKITLRNRAIGYGEEDNDQYCGGFTYFAHGAAMIVRADSIKKVGLMPEDYFLYYEEIDWSTRFKLAGYKIYVDPRCTVFHKESQTTGQNSPLKSYYLTRNRLKYCNKYRNGIIKVLSLTYLIFIVSLLNIASALCRSEKEIAKSTLRGVIDFVKDK